MQTFTDGITNLVQQLGFSADNSISKTFYTPSTISYNREQLEALYSSNWIVKRACEVYAEDLVKNGINIISPTLTPDEVSYLQKKLDQLRIWQSLQKAITQARLFGGAVAIFLIHNQDPFLPLDAQSINHGDFRGLYVLDRWNIQPSLETLVSEFGPYYGEPKYYEILTSDTNNLQNRIIHYTRLSKFIGQDVPYNLKIQQQYWGLSSVAAGLDALMGYDTAMMSITQLLQKAYSIVLKIPDFTTNMVANPEFQQGVAELLKFLRITRSTENISVIDGTYELEDKTYTFAGLKDIVSKFQEQVAGFTEIPLPRLFGISPQGFSNGENELRQYYDSIRSKQESILRPTLYTILRLICKSYLDKPLPEDVDFTFAPLSTPTDTEIADISSKDLSSIVDLYNAGLYTREIALSEIQRLSRDSGRGTSVTDADIKIANQRTNVLKSFSPVPIAPAPSANALRGYK